jgi:hypothetical protein
LRRALEGHSEDAFLKIKIAAASVGSDHEISAITSYGVERGERDNRPRTATKFLIERNKACRIDAVALNQR